MHGSVFGDRLQTALLATSAVFGLSSAWRPFGTRMAVLAKGFALQLLLCAMGMQALKMREAMLHLPPTGEGTPPLSGPWMLIPAEPLEKAGASYRTVSDAWRFDGTAFEYAGRCLTHLRLNDGSPVPAMGSPLLTEQVPEAILDQGNPGGFNAESYHRIRGVAMTTFLDEERYVRLPGNEGSRFMAWLYETRDGILRIIRANIRDPRALGIAEALLIGYRGHLDRSVSEAYAGTGVIHVIAISGLHIGMIYGIAMALVGWVLGRSSAERYRPIVVLPLLWAFGLMSGGSASVMRSVCMFTVMGLGKSLLGRRGRPFNTLCATAFLLLAFRPHWIADVGFQLSFTAVAGIMSLYPAIRSMASFENGMAAHLWDMVALTLSAQLLTTPLILHHFGRFPLLFLFTNTVAIPLSSLILLAELLLCAVSPLPDAARWLGKTIESAILWMNAYVADMDGIPHANLEGLSLSVTATVLLYLFIGSCSMMLKTRRRDWLLTSLSSLCLLSASVAREAVERRRQSCLVIPHLKGMTACLVVSGESGRWLISSPSSDREAEHARRMQDMERHYKVSESEKEVSRPSAVKSLEWRGRRILELGKGAPRDPGELPFRPDLILLTGNADVDPAAWHLATGCTTWVADGSNSLWKIQKWKTLAAGLPLRFHPTSQRGAFILQD